MNTAPQETVQTALARVSRLLASRPDAAEAQARECLRTFPGQPDVQLLLAMALRAQGRGPEALALLSVLKAAHPGAPAVFYELGLYYAERDERLSAVTAFRETVRLNPRHSKAWRALADQYTLAGDAKAAEDAYAQHVKTMVNAPQLKEAAAALSAGRFDVAEKGLRAFLIDNPADVVAMRLLAEVAERFGHFDEAESLLARTLELAPGFDSARHHYAIILHRHNKSQDALAHIELLVQREPRHPGYRVLEAAILARLGEYDRAIAAYRAVLADHPHQPKTWLSLGHALKAVGDSEGCVEAYRKAFALEPSLGEAYWCLANLKTFRFSGAEIAAMRLQLQRTDLQRGDRLHLHFALGAALETEGAYADAFAEYEKANALRRAEVPYDADDTDRLCARLKAQCTRAFFAAHAGCGTPTPGPIFIVGLPRSGSTLVEQILASHSAIEGTMELPDLPAIVRRLGGGDRRLAASDYPQALAALKPEDFVALGEEYFRRTRIQRKTAKPFFIDKTSSNFLHVGLIHLILPQARIIDVRRHPFGCCFSCFKQHFARGRPFAYSLTDLGRYYAAYADLMEYYEAALPGKVVRVYYEKLVSNPEAEVRALLDACGLPFEADCLAFYRNPRSVRTPSAEQVRQPIYTEARDHWRVFAPWLEPLRAALGQALDVYPIQ